MPRKAREKSKSGIYHIIMRGINRQTIYEDEKDYVKYKQTLLEYKEKSGYEVYAYCLMGNHVHLLIQVKKEPLEQIMRRICGSYVYWYNQKYGRVGNLFQDRFKSEPVEDDSYLLAVLRYIHQNPVKAGLEEKIGYKWSSYNEYLGIAWLVDVDYILNIFSENRDKAIQQFVNYHSEVSEETCLEMEEKRRITDEEAIKIAKKVCGVDHVAKVQDFELTTRNKCLRALKEEYGLSIRQIERITGINRGIVLKA